MHAASRWDNEVVGHIPVSRRGAAACSHHTLEEERHMAAGAEVIHTEMVGRMPAEAAGHSCCIAEVVVGSHTAEEGEVQNCRMVVVGVDHIHLGCGHMKEVGGCKAVGEEDYRAAGEEDYRVAGREHRSWGMTYCESIDW